MLVDLGLVNINCYVKTQWHLATNSIRVRVWPQTIYDLNFVLSLLDLSWIAVALEMLGKFALTAGSNLMYVYIAEIYPTVLRNTAAGSCSILSRVGSTIAPFLFKLSECTLF